MEEGQSSSNPTFTKPRSMQDDEVTFPKAKKQRKLNKKVIIIIVVILVIIAIVVGFFALGGRSEEDGVDTISPTPTLKVQPTSIPIPQPVDKKILKIQLLNGTGIPGEAAFLQGKFENLGYEDIEADNADSSDNESTSVSFSDKVGKDSEEEVTYQLEEIYEDVDVVKDKDLEYDIKVVIGYRKGHTSTPTKAPTVTEKPAPTSTSSAETSD